MHLYDGESASGTEKEADEGEPMDPFERSSESFVVATQSEETRKPCEAALDHPSVGKKFKTSFGFVEFDHFKR